MTRTTVAEELRILFRAHAAGYLSTAEFRRRKHMLLDWSRCCLTRIAPRRMRWVRNAAPVRPHLRLVDCD